MTDEKMTNDQILMNLVDNISLYVDESGNTYAEIRDSSGENIFCETSSGQLYEWLFSQYVQHSKNKFPPPNSIKNALGYARVKARQKNHKVTVGLRFGYYDKSYYIDMANKYGELIRVNSKGWETVTDSPVKFLRKPHQRQLRDPLAFGEASLMLKYLNIKSEKHKMLALVTLCTMPLVNIVRPILGFIGPEGSAKTTAARLFKRVFDECAPLETNFKNNADDIHLMFYNHSIPLIDNLSPVKKFVSDIFCKATTGEGYTKRELYTDMEQVVISYRRPIIFTAIETPSQEPDFLDRCLLIEFDSIPDDQRYSESELIKSFDVDLPKILGGCLNTISLALKIFPEIEIKKTVRLADFAHMGAAIAEALGYKPEAFISALSENINRKKRELVGEKEPVLSAVVQLVEAQDSFDGTTSQLFEKIQRYKPSGSTKKEGWPRGANGLGRIIKRIMGTLQQQGIIVEKKSTNKGTFLSIYKDENYEDIEIEDSRENLKKEYTVEIISPSRPPRIEDYEDEDDDDDEIPF